MRISKRRRITIPKSLRDQFGMHRNAEVEISPTSQGLLIRKRAADQHPVDQVYGILGKDALGEGAGVDEYIEDIRGKRQQP